MRERAVRRPEQIGIGARRAVGLVSGPPQRETQPAHVVDHPNQRPLPGGDDPLTLEIAVEDLVDRLVSGDQILHPRLDPGPRRRGIQRGAGGNEVRGGRHRRAERLAEPGTRPARPQGDSGDRGDHGSGRVRTESRGKGVQLLRCGDRDDVRQQERQVRRVDVPAQDQHVPQGKGHDRGDDQGRGQTGRGQRPERDQYQTHGAGHEVRQEPGLERAAEVGQHQQDEHAEGGVEAAGPEIEDHVHDHGDDRHHDCCAGSLA